MSYLDSMRPSIEKLKLRGISSIEQELKGKGPEPLYRILLVTALAELTEENDIQMSFNF
jgi:hypothetical protein